VDAELEKLIPPEPQRADFREIIEIIPDKSRVLDLGCAGGDLLYYLVKFKNVDARGVEIEEENVMQCIQKGLTVYQSDIDEGLRDYQDGTFDYVILNLTIQVVHRPVFVLNEMLRVGKRCIVGFPNFGHWKFRLKLLATGRMPKTNALPFEWFDTPNIHLLTIKDFEILCAERGIRILRKVAMKNATEKDGTVVSAMPNLLAEYGLFEIARA
jgi:methionine biosynthesis protein MetW